MTRSAPLFLVLSCFVLSCFVTACGGDDDGPPDVPSDGGRPDVPSDGGPPGECVAFEEQSGEGTYYDATGAGACSFDAQPGGELLVAAMNAPQFAGSGVCGMCARVVGPAGEVTVRIVDLCPECASGDLDLSPDAFARIAELERGRVPITWREVPCAVSGPIGYHFQDGANAFYTAIQVRNHRYPIAKLEAEVDGAYVEIERLEYNYFVEADGLGDGPYALRVTDTRGHVVEDLGVELGDDVTRVGTAQFPLCP